MLIFLLSMFYFNGAVETNIVSILSLTQFFMTCCGACQDAFIIWMPYMEAVMFSWIS